MVRVNKNWKIDLEIKSLHTLSRPQRMNDTMNNFEIDAPRWSGRTKLTFAVDIWSISALLCDLLTGVPLFRWAVFLWFLFRNRCTESRQPRPSFQAIYFAFARNFSSRIPILNKRRDKSNYAWQYASIDKTIKNEQFFSSFHDHSDRLFFLL